MWQNVTVKNFRCFSGLFLEPLARVNLIAGKNNTGKTALLEAIHLHNHPADCQLPVTINKARGIKKAGKAISIPILFDSSSPGNYGMWRRVLSRYRDLRGKLE